jgi:hypothetical protein
MITPSALPPPARAVALFVLTGIIAYLRKP